MRRCSKLLAALVLASLAAPLAAQEHGEELVERPALALMGTIPIYWGEAAGIDELLAGSARPHWARAALEREFTLVPLDYLAAETLAGQSMLLMAQPRGLTAEENVALDAWVRGGGRLVLVADPLLTGESRFHIGDRRRPQDVALLSPILARWGLELHFDESQPEGPLVRDIAGKRTAVNLAGHFEHAGGVASPCALGDGGIVARCAIGEGQAVLLADAAFLDVAGPYAGAEDVLGQLLREAMGTAREAQVHTATESAQQAESQGNSSAARAAIAQGGDDSTP